MTNTALNATYNSLLNIMDKHRGRLHEIKLGADLFEKVLDNMHVDQVLMYNWKQLNPKLKLRKASNKEVISRDNYRMVFVDEVSNLDVEETPEPAVEATDSEVVTIGSSVKIVQSASTKNLKRDNRHPIGKSGKVLAEIVEEYFVIEFNDGSGAYTVPKRNVVLESSSVEVPVEVATPTLEVVTVGSTVKIVQSGDTALKRDKRHLLGKNGTVLAETAEGYFVIEFSDGSGIYTIPKRNVVLAPAVEVSVVKVKETRAVKAGYNKGYNSIANLKNDEHAIKEFLLKNPEYTGVEFVERYFLAEI